LILFARYPLPGGAKTRLIPSLGPTRAAHLQRRMTEHACTIARPTAAARHLDIEVRYAGGDRRRMRRWLGGEVHYARQGPGDLGQRMRRAFDAAFAEGCRRVVLVGTDCPATTPQDLHRAFESLADRDVVLGPSTDGGYWLIGLRRPAELFAGVAWSTPGVLAQTLARTRSLGQSVAVLRTLPDVDTFEDLSHVPATLLPPAAFVSVIIPAVNESQHMAAAARSATADGAEVIVVDGGSTDATPALAAEAGARVIASPRGRAAQQNRGAAVASGEVLLFLHADTRLPRGYVDHVFDACGDPRVVGGAFEFATDWRHPAMSVLAGLVRLRSRAMGLPYGDQGLWVRRAVFERLGGFADLAVAEDLDFVRRLKRCGRIVVAAAPAVTSARRWRQQGVLRTTLANQLIVGGCYLGVPDRWLLRLRHSVGGP